MARVLFFLALFVAAASAFVSPASNAGEFLRWTLVALSRPVSAPPICHRESFQFAHQTHLFFLTSKRTTTVTSPAFARTTSAKMVPVEATEVVSSFVQNANVIATNADEFGGYFYPVAGIALLSALILYLSPPLSD